MNFENTQKFQRNFKKLSKKYKSLDNDLAEFKKILKELPLGIDKYFNVITQTEILCIVKARLFCRCLKGSSLRIIYSYFNQKQRIEFIELYSKNNKESENKKRIEEYLKNNQNLA